MIAHNTHPLISARLSRALSASALSVYQPSALALFDAQGGEGAPAYVAILGDVFDVSSKPEFYGALGVFLLCCVAADGGGGVLR